MLDFFPFLCYIESNPITFKEVTRMKLDSKYYSYCKQIGILKENCSHQAALDCLIKAVKSKPQADPKFVAAMERLTLSSPEVSIRSCMLYRYDIELDYWVNGTKKHGRIADFGQSGVHDSLRITDYAGDGTYTVLKDFSTVPYALYNDRNVFTFEEMKSALKGIINKQIPKGTTRYESTDWWVSAYVVPVLVVSLNFNGKEYQMYYNLQNNRYHFKWADNPEIKAKAKKAKNYASLAKFGGFAFAILAVLLAALNGGFHKGLFFMSLAAFAVIFIISRKAAPNYETVFTRKPSMKVSGALKAPLAMLILGAIPFLIVLIATAVL